MSFPTLLARLSSETSTCRKRYGMRRGVACSSTWGTARHHFPGRLRRSPPQRASTRCRQREIASENSPNALPNSLFCVQDIISTDVRGPFFGPPLLLCRVAHGVVAAPDPHRLLLRPGLCMCSSFRAGFLSLNKNLCAQDQATCMTKMLVKKSKSFL